GQGQPTAEGPTQPWGWMYQLLPFVEQDNLFKIPGGAGTVGDQIIQKSPVALYNCPSRRPPTIIGAVVLTDYAGNAGVTWCPANEANTWNGTIVPAYVNTPPGYTSTTWVKVGNVTIPAISDGTSNTLLLGEKFVSTDQYATGAEWGDNNTWAIGNTWISTRCAAHQPKRDQPESTLTKETPVPNY